MHGVPRVAIEDSMPAGERTDRQLAATSAEHDRRHLKHASGFSFTFFVNFLSNFTLTLPLPSDVSLNKSFNN